MRVRISCHKVDYPLDWDWESGDLHSDDVGLWGRTPEYGGGDHYDPGCDCVDGDKENCDASVMWWNCPGCEESYLIRWCLF
jgi:hypothetical protein